MSQNSAAHLARVEHAVKTLLKAPALTVSQAMILAHFSKKGVANYFMSSGGGELKTTTTDDRDINNNSNMALGGERIRMRVR